jgi:lauroyl/myristoyl acyltransferase
VGRARRPEGEGRLIQLVYHGYVIFSLVARWLPEGFAYRLANVIGDIAAKRSKKKTVVAMNMARITGKDAGSAEVQDLVVQAYRSYARYWLETFRLVREDADFFLDRFRCEDDERLFGAVQPGRGAIVAVSHLGNYDAAGAWVGANGHSLVTVAEVLKPRRMFDFFVDHRARLGMTIHPATKGVTARLVEAVNAGAVVAVLADRDLKGTGPEVEFFGAPATFPPGAASIAIETQAPMFFCPIFGVRHADGKRGWAASIGQPLDVPKEKTPEAIQYLTQQIARELEKAVAQRPEEWHVLQPFWIADKERRQ